MKRISLAALIATAFRPCRFRNVKRTGVLSG